MSLLIKALDSAERTKQAEKDKKQAAESTTTPVALELESLKTDQVVPAFESEVQRSMLTESPDKDLAITPSEPQKTANTLTLEEEAGLSNPLVGANKYAKPKSAGVKAPVSSAPLKDSLGETQKGAKPEAVTASIPATSTSHTRPIAVDANQKTAAKVFVANQAVKSPSSKYALLALGVAGALIIWMGLQGYTYIKPLLAPATVAIKPAAPLLSESIAIEPVPIDPVAIPDTQILSTGEQVLSNDASNSTPMAEKPPVDVREAVDTINVFTKNLNANLRASAPTQANGVLAAGPSVPVNTATNIATNTAVIENTGGNKSANEASSGRDALKVTSKRPSPAIDPTLLSAYQAFTRGDDSIAQQQYRLVLQKDVRNIDALLGMAAIAQRQERHADAMGWFQKVLEIEPRNSIALSSIINSQTANDTVASESRLKSMIASQPSAAHLHAALGNIYAEQNQWMLAQEAYFNASRFAPNNADYVFNLAISLDHLGKTSLALKQYQRALELLNQTGASSPDRGQLEARIQTLQ